ncbi:putative UDP-glycosyltransferase TURAN [Paratrimastix pyriformis]|uniref:UDP-glycosyltransferase TURAN n=1 Tax=Paratrimastix pyriformis TaxID=342808 RepID=A0ABQ8ULF1_9EUKA|nr:putative UDP-glycosyltransferase TURAN [Paratrimastix pyriformis]
MALSVSAGTPASILFWGILGGLTTLLVPPKWRIYMALVVGTIFLALRTSWHREPSVTVLVLGDIGHSPRMQYHALSLSEYFHVDFVGTSGSDPRQEILDNRHITLHRMRGFPKCRLPFLVVAPLKVFFQIFQILGHLLFSVRHPSFILLQNPPSIPTMALVWGTCLLRGSRFIVDWHNLGYSILAMRFPSRGCRHPIVRLAKIYERVFGRLADRSFCVSSHMQQWLLQNFGVRAQVLCDRPPPFFRRAQVEETHAMCLRYPAIFGSSGARTVDPAQESLQTMLTISTPEHGLSIREDRPAVVVSGTSWTADEDFGVLVEALELCEARVAGLPDVARKCFPHVQVIITGKGPLKSAFETRVASRHWTHFTIATAWLEAADYPILLGSADLGVSMHQSTALGLDLPMKVVDMFGCGLPAVARRFLSIDELVTPQKGLIFETASELADQIFGLLSDWPRRQRLREFAEAITRDWEENRWEDNWRKCALPLFGNPQRRVCDALPAPLAS